MPNWAFKKSVQLLWPLCRLLWHTKLWKMTFLQFLSHMCQFFTIRQFGHISHMFFARFHNEKHKGRASLDTRHTLKTGQKWVKCVKNRKNVCKCRRRCDRNVFFDGFWENYPNRRPSRCSRTWRKLVKKRKHTKTWHVQKVSKMCKMVKNTFFHKNDEKKLKKKFCQTGPLKKVCNFCDHFVTLFDTFVGHV